MPQRELSVVAVVNKSWDILKSTIRPFAADYHKISSTNDALAYQDSSSSSS